MSRFICGDTIIVMDIIFDQTKRDVIFHERKLRFEDSTIIFAGDTADMVDDRKIMVKSA